jgi:hypothetical protein
MSHGLFLACLFFSRGDVSFRYQIIHEMRELEDRVNSGTFPKMLLFDVFEAGGAFVDFELKHIILFNEQERRNKHELAMLRKDKHFMKTSKTFHQNVMDVCRKTALLTVWIGRQFGLGKGWVTILGCDSVFCVFFFFKSFCFLDLTTLLGKMVFGMRLEFLKYECFAPMIKDVRFELRKCDLW